MGEVELLEGGKWVTRKLCKTCEYNDRVYTIEDVLSLIFPLTGRAITKEGRELTFSPPNERDFIVLIKKELF